MALIKCAECSKEVSERAITCPNCGAPIANASIVKINFPVWGSPISATKQMFMNNCYVYDENGKEIVRCKQGETVSLNCTSPMNISVKMQNCFGKPKQLIKPGENYKIEFRGFGKIFLSKVDHII